MRWIYASLAVISLLAGAETQAAKPSRAVHGDEVTVSAAATGVSVVPADKATVNFVLTKSGPDQQKARDAVRALATEITGELVALGLSRGDIDLQESSRGAGFVGNEQAQGVTTVNDYLKMMKGPRSASASLLVTISDLRLLPKLRQFIDEKCARVMDEPAFTLTNDRRARDTAIGDGMTKARQDAEAYAAALGMRVGRVISVSSPTGDNPFSIADYARMVERLTGKPEVRSGMVRTSVDMVVKFGLVRR